MKETMLKYLETTGVLLATPPSMPTEKTLLRMYKTLVTTRLVDERMITLQRQGKISFALSSLGEEGCIVASAAALAFEDWIYPQYREVGALFYRGYSIQAYVHHMFGNREDPILGRQMPNHFGSKEHHVVPVSSPIGTKIPHATGAGYAMQLLGEKTVALSYFGDGAASEGDFHAGLNFAAVFKTPTLFFCRNNGYAISTPLSSQFAAQGIVQRASGYGMAGERVDGNDVFAVYDAVQRARQRAVEGEGPTLIEAMTYRLGAHSTSDDPSGYRQKEEEQVWQERCPILRLRRYLEKRDLWSEEEEKTLRDEVVQQLQQAVELAQKTPPPEKQSLIEDVYKKTPALLQQQLEEFA